MPANAGIHASPQGLVLKWIPASAGMLSLGQAARFSGYSKRAFMELLGKHGVPVIDYPAEDLKGEMDL